MGICTKYLFISYRSTETSHCVSDLLTVEIIFYVYLTFYYAALTIIDTLFVIQKNNNKNNNTGASFSNSYLCVLVFVFLFFDNSVCTCLAKSNMDILILRQDCSKPIRPSSDLKFLFSVLLFMFVYV